MKLQWVLLVLTYLLQDVFPDAQSHKLIRPFRRRRIESFQAKGNTEKTTGGGHNNEQIDSIHRKIKAAGSIFAGNTARHRVKERNRTSIDTSSSSQISSGVGHRQAGPVAIKHNIKGKRKQKPTLLMEPGLKSKEGKTHESKSKDAKKDSQKHKINDNLSKHNDSSEQKYPTEKVIIRITKSDNNTNRSLGSPRDKDKSQTLDFLTQFLKTFEKSSPFSDQL